MKLRLRRLGGRQTFSTTFHSYSSIRSVGLPVWSRQPEPANFAKWSHAIPAWTNMSRPLLNALFAIATLSNRGSGAKCCEYIYMHPLEREACKNHGNQWQRFHCGWIKTNSETARFSCAMLRLIRNITSENGVRARIPVTYSMSNTMRMQRTAFELVGEQKYE